MAIFLRVSTYNVNLEQSDLDSLPFCTCKAYLASTFIVGLSCNPDGLSGPYLCSLNIGSQAHAEMPHSEMPGL